MKYIGNRTYTTINAFNSLERDVTFNMYTVPETAINIGDCWGWVGFDRSSYDWNVANNIRITEEAKAAEEAAKAAEEDAAKSADEAA